MTGGTARESPNDEIDLREIATILWRGKFWIGICTAVGSAVAIAYVSLATSTYRAEALVQIRGGATASSRLDSLSPATGGLSSLADIVGTNSERALALAALKSRTVIQAFIRDKDLLPVLFPEMWNPEVRQWTTSDPRKVPTLWKGYKLFSEHILKVTEEKKSGLVTIAIEWRDPVACADWATEIIARTNNYLKDRAIFESEQNLDYLRQQGKQTDLVEIQQAVYTLVELEMKKLMLARGRGEYALQTIDPAQAPQFRIWPQPLLITITGTLLGLLAGSVFVYTRKILA